MVNCNYENYGCEGGYLTTTIEYLQNEGLVPSDCNKYQEKIKSCTYECELGEYKKHFCKIGSLKALTTVSEI